MKNRQSPRVSSKTLLPDTYQSLLGKSRADLEALAKQILPYRYRVFMGMLGDNVLIYAVMEELFGQNWPEFLPVTQKEKIKKEIIYGHQKMLERL